MNNKLKYGDKCLVRNNENDEWGADLEAQLGANLRH